MPKTLERYEGQWCLQLLERWQTGESAGVVAFLQRKLEPLPFADLTRQIQALQREDGARARVERLEHGRRLNRGMNLLQALEPICTLPEQRLLDEVRAACAHYGHQPDQIRQQLVEREAARSAFVLHPALAQRNMLVMDQLGVQITTDAPDQPEQRTWGVAKRPMPEGPYAEQVIRGYVALTSPWQNNPIGRRFLAVPMPISARANTTSAQKEDAPRVEQSLRNNGTTHHEKHLKRSVRGLESSVMHPLGGMDSSRSAPGAACCAERK